MKSRIVNVKIGNTEVGPTMPCFIVAEAGVNHNGDPEMAHALVEAAASAGADAVKFQTFKTERLVSGHACKAEYQLAATGADDATQTSMLKALELNEDVFLSLLKHCTALGITFLSTPYDLPSAFLLKDIGVSALKVASTDATNLPFLRQLDSLELPIILSTGMCDLLEVREAVDALSTTRNAKRLVLLQCTSEYPAPEDELDISVIPSLATEFVCPAGFSDHTKGIDAGAWAVAAGATFIEKHFTLDRSLPGPDHRASLEPAEFARMIAEIRRVEIACGGRVKRIQQAERENKPAMQKGLVMTRSLPKGATLSPGDVECKRPATGLLPRYLESVYGARLSRAVCADDPLTPHDLVDWPKNEQPMS